ncbi:TRAP transporter small permease subunit [Aquisalimonas lutea]|uniref:TRAP transporter small permease subunit n=1 Tax=Aquisalimonas lutea TaxID=1327750 RepID=UPI0025B2954B|nr:TRAP transporter small permease subunit [Aquisalimonas lutea]MDN3517929.1 TRAP transporter small permease subunit [Aquisalimonas lutea]
MTILERCCSGITALNRWLASAVSVLVFIMVAVIAYEVVARYFFNAPTVWALELSTLLFGPYFMLAGPYMLHIGAHVNVDILYNRLPRRGAAIMDCLIYPVIIAMCVIAVDQSWPLAMNAYESGETSFSAWNPPIWPIKFVIPAAFALLLLQALAETVRALHRATGGAEPAGEATP